MITTQEKQNIITALQNNNAKLEKMPKTDLAQKDIQELKETLRSIRNNIDSVLQSLGENPEQSGSFTPVEETAARAGWKPRKSSRIRKHDENALRIVEGVFDGEHMMGADGKRYLVPQNYASKSKLVEGDILKLIIGQDGDFTYKQISPIERKKEFGTLVYNKELDHYFVVSGSKSWKVLGATISYFDGQHGDEAVFYLPKNSVSSWAAIETIIHSEEDTDIDVDAVTAEHESSLQEAPEVEEFDDEERGGDEEIEELDLEEAFDPFSDNPMEASETAIQVAFELGLQRIDMELEKQV